MTIDWITVSAQIINFLILVWLLKRFLYQPIINAMTRREQHIAARLKEAAERERVAEEAAHSFEDRKAELERERDDILADAEEEARERKRRRLDEAREEVAETRRSWLRQSRLEKDEFLDKLRRQASEGVQAIARKVLADLADSELESRVVDTFIERLESLGEETRERLAASSGPMRVSSAFPLDSSSRARLTRVLHKHVLQGMEVEYVESPELLCGIELRRCGQKLSWNLAEYLDVLGERVESAFAPTETAGE